MNPRLCTCLMAALAAVATACSKPDPPRRIDVGVHQVTVRMPAGWATRDEKQQVVIHAPPLTDAALRELDRKGEISIEANAEVRIRDLGPVTPTGMLREVAAVQELWRTGRVDEAKVRLRSVPLRSALLPTLAPPSDFARAWSTIRHASEQTPYEDVAANFAVIAAGLDATSPPELPAIVDWALPRVDRTRLTSVWHLSGGPFDGEENDALATRPDAQSRDIVWRKNVTVDRRNAEEIETWENLTHAQPRRLLFLVNNDHLLVVTSEFGGGEHSIRGYETVRTSLHLLP